MQMYILWAIFKYLWINFKKVKLSRVSDFIRVNFSKLKESNSNHEFSNLVFSNLDVWDWIYYTYPIQPLKSFLIRGVEARDRKRGLNVMTNFDLERLGPTLLSGSMMQASCVVLLLPHLAAANHVLDCHMRAYGSYSNYITLRFLFLYLQITTFSFDFVWLSVLGQ